MARAVHATIFPTEMKESAAPRHADKLANTSALVGSDTVCNAMAAISYLAAELDGVPLLGLQERGQHGAVGRHTELKTVTHIPLACWQDMSRLPRLTGISTGKSESFNLIPTSTLFVFLK